MPTVAYTYDKFKDLPELEEYVRKSSKVPPEKSVLVADVDDTGKLTKLSVEEAPGVVSSAVMGAALGVVPSLIAAPVAVGAGALGTVAGGPVAGIAAGGAAGLGTGLAVQKAQDWALRKVMPKTMRRQDIRRQVNPKASLIGGLASGAAGQKSLVGALFKKSPALLKGGEAYGKALAADEVLRAAAQDRTLGSALARNMAAGAGIGAAQDVALQGYNVAQGGEFSWPELALSTAGGSVIGGGPSRLFPEASLRPAMSLQGRLIERGKLTPEGKRPTPIGSDKVFQQEFAGMDERAAAVKMAKALIDPNIPEARKVEMFDSGRRNYGWKDRQSVLAFADAVTKQEAAAAEKAKTTPERITADLQEGKVTPGTYDQGFAAWLRAEDGANLGRPVKGAWKRYSKEEAIELSQRDEIKSQWYPKYEEYKKAEAAAEAAKKRKKPDAVQKPSTTPVLSRQQGEAGETGSVGEGVGPGKQGEGTPREGKQGGTEVPVKDQAAEIEAAINDMVDRRDSGELKNLDWELIKAGLDKLPVRYQPGEVEATAAHEAINRVIALVERQSGLQPGELLSKDSKQVLTLGPWKLGRNLDEAVSAAKRLANSLAKDIKLEGETVLQTDDVQSVVDANKRAPGQTLPVGGSSKEEPQIGKPTTTGEVPPSGPRDPSFDLSNPEHAQAKADIEAAFGLSLEEYNKRFTNQDYVENPPGTPVEVTPSDIEGRGTVNTVNLKAGDTIGKIKVPRTDNPKSAIQTVLGRFTNHSRTPNAEVVRVNRGSTEGQVVDDLVLRALTDIPFGTELTVDYRKAIPVAADWEKNLAVTGGELKVTAAKKPRARKPKTGQPVVAKVAPESTAEVTSTTGKLSPSPAMKEMSGLELEFDIKYPNWRVMTMAERSKEWPAAAEKFKRWLELQERPFESAELESKGTGLTAEDVFPVGKVPGEGTTAPVPVPAAAPKPTGDFTTSPEYRAGIGALAKSYKQYTDATDPEVQGTAGAEWDMAGQELMAKYGLNDSDVAGINRKIAKVIDEGGDIVSAVNEGVAAYKPSKTGKPVIRGEAGAIGAWGDVARSVPAVAKDIATKTGQVFRGAGKGPKGGELYSTPIHIIAKETVSALSKLVGKPLNAVMKIPGGFAEGVRLSKQFPAEGGLVDQTFSTYMRWMRRHLNDFTEPIVAAEKLKLSSKQWEKLGRYADDMDDPGVSAIGLTPDEQKAYNLCRETLNRQRMAQNKAGVLNAGKPVAPTGNFTVKTLMSKEAREALNGNDQAARDQYNTQYLNWAKTVAPDADENTVIATLNTMVGSDPFSGKHNPEFDPLTTPAGIGLPRSMREPNLLKRVQFYARHWATGLAWHQVVHQNPAAARIFGVNTDSKGNVYKAIDKTSGKEMLLSSVRDISPLTPNAADYAITDFTPVPVYAKNLTGNPHLEAFRNYMNIGKKTDFDWIDQGTAIANSYLLGVGTTIRDITASGFGVLGEQTRASDIPAYGRAIATVLSGKSRAVEAGGVVKRHTAALDLSSSINQIGAKIAAVGNKYQGRDLGERGIREVLWEFGREVTKARLSEGDTKFLEHVGGKQWQKLLAKNREDFLDHCAGVFMENMQGNYGPQFLHRYLLPGSGSGKFTKAMLSLSRFSIERTERFRRNVVVPLAEGNPVPFVKSLAIYMGLAAPAANAILGLLGSRKPKNTTWGELFNLWRNGAPAKELMDEFAYDFLANAALTGFAGILANAAYNLENVRHGERALGYSNPAWSAVTDMGQRIVDYINAYPGGAKFELRNLIKLPWQTMVDSIQNVRIGSQMISPWPETGAREEQIYKRMTGQTTPVWIGNPRANPFAPTTKMRRATTAEEIWEQGPALENVYLHRSPKKAGRFENPMREEGYYNFREMMEPGSGQEQMTRDIEQKRLNVLRSAVANKAFNQARFRKRMEELQP